MTVAKNVLCIEDNNDNLDLICRFLKRRGYNPLRARDGIAGLEIAKTNPIELIFLDINLPIMSGYEVLKYLKLNDKLSLVPTIAITANSISASRKKCLEAGFDDYISKPVLRKELDEILQHYLGVNS